MSVHLEYLMKQMRNLPFTDMVRIAENLRLEIEKRKGDDLDAYVIAHALLNACDGPQKLSDMTQNEERVFVRAFNRKKQITILRDGGKWRVELPSMKGAHCLGTELRATLGQLLDTAATIHILTEK